MDGIMLLFKSILFVITCTMICDQGLAYKETIRVERLHKKDRHKRDTDFPETLMYDLYMRELRVPLRLRKHHASVPATTITGAGGETSRSGKFRFQMNYGMYIDPVTSAIIAVYFDDLTGESRLFGNFYLHDEGWHISPSPGIGHADMTHVVEKKEQANDVRKPMTQLSKAVNPNEEMGDVSVKQVGTSQLGDTGLNASTSGLLKRYRRQVPEGCNVMETAVIVDETIVDFHLNLTGGDFNAAVMSINMYYSVIFTEKCDPSSERRQSGNDVTQIYEKEIESIIVQADDLCLRVYLSEVIVPEPSAPVWTEHQVRDDGTLDENSLFHGCRFAARDANFSRGNDYVLCATRRDITVVNDPEYRVYGYQRFLCAPVTNGFNSGMFEDRLDDVSLLIAHVLSFGFGVDNDVIEGCNDADNFLMSTFNRVPFDPATITNPWNLSSCTADFIRERIMNFTTVNLNCLMDNDFTDAEFNDRLVDQPLAGEIYDVDFQCAYRFGIGSTACIGPGETSITDVDDLCHVGVFCNVNGDCSNSTRSRVLNGTPCGEDKVCFKNLCEEENGTETEEDDESSLCGDCDDSMECPENAECDSGLNICLCIEGFSTSECGVCVENKDLGENCTDGVDCKDECAVCDPKDGVCVCFGATFDNNTVNVDGGVCLPKVNNTAMCPQADACLDINAVCNAMHICECKPNFVLDSNNICIPVTVPGTICQSCFNDSDCTIGNTECVEVDGSKICKCKSNFFLNICGVCTERIQNGGNCSGDAICADPSAVCTPDDICVCFEDTYDNNTSAMPGGTCFPKIPTGNPCPVDNTDDVCLDDNAMCNGTCVCMEGFKLNASDICVPLLDLCESCGDDHDCGGVFTECIDDGMGMGKICRCMENHSVDKCGICTENIPNGGNCSNEVECADPYAVCSPDDTCECFGDNYDNNTAAISGGTCLPKISTGDPCPPDNTDDVCLDENAMCDGTICVCKEGFKSNSSDICVPLSGLCEPCEDNGCCGGENTECIDDGMGMGKICRCKKSYFPNKCGVCTEKKQNGGNCSGDAICADPNAVCTPDDICVCYEDTYDNNTSGVLGGTCLPKISTGDPCPPNNMDDVCLDENAMCNGTICVCMGGFKLNASGICVPLSGLCEPCEDNACCGGENTECIDDGMGMGKICRCKESYFPNKCGVCTEKIQNGGNCSGDAICADPNAVCTPDDICVCFEDTYDNNTSAMPGGTCFPKIPTGVPCPVDNTDDVCLDDNAMCNGTCVCMEGFKLNASGICVPLLALCEVCNDNHDCGGDFTECIDDGKGMDKVCRCMQTHFENKCGECQEKIPLGGNCSYNAMCQDPSAVCPNGICICLGDTYDNNTVNTPGGTCVPKEPNGDPCDQDDACLDVNAECNGTICVCKEGFILNADNVCLPGNGTTPDPEIGLCDPCENNNDCDVNNTFCKDLGASKECRCMEGFFVNKCGECEPDVELGGNCTDNKQCEDANAVCGPDNTCVCFGDTYDNNGSHPGGMCIPKESNGDPCNPTDACLDVNAACINNVCTCKDGFMLNNLNICVPDNDTTVCPQELCTPCTDDANCTLPDTTCDQHTGQCRCKDGFFVDVCGDCTPKVGLGSNCSMDSMCLDPQAVCDPEIDECVCFGDFYDDNFCTVPGGTCDPKIEVGEICVLPNSCLDPNANCSLTSRCKCNSGFFPNDHLQCVPLLPPGSSCNDDKECVDNAECNADNECECENNFEEECGECVPVNMQG